MPIIISEIAITVEVAPNNNAQGNHSSGSDALRRDDIINECVEKVMEIINLKNER
jgi:hypothetical protein